MAQWFHVFFFELPGHGQSTPFQERFSSHQVAVLVEELADALGFEHFNLMGFSFGGILAMRTFVHLSRRIDRLILIAPCMGRRALNFSPLRWHSVYLFNRILSNSFMQARFFDLLHHPISLDLIVRFFRNVGRVEPAIPLHRKLTETHASTIAVLNTQIDEILTTEFAIAPVKYDTPCYFAMSVYDPLLIFDTTLNIVHQHFADVNTVRLTYPFHQPPRPFTYAELNRDFYETVNAFLGSEKQI